MSLPGDEIDLATRAAATPRAEGEPGDPHLGPVESGGGGAAHDRFGPEELAIVLSRWDLGEIRRVRAFRRGSRRAPKLRIDGAAGDLLLKRRAPGRDTAPRLAFWERLHRHLLERDYPVAPLLPTRDGALIARWRGSAYELFRYVHGRRDDGSTTAARESGRLLGRLHAATADFAHDVIPDAGSFHADPRVPKALDRAPSAIFAVEADVDRSAIEQVTAKLRDRAIEAAERVAAEGFSDLPPAVLHGDWHPGNLRYAEGRIVAVLDFDAARIEPRVVDVANAALQASMSSGPADDPESWPDELDGRRLVALVRGYEEATGAPLTAAEHGMLPWLVIEALIAESALPVAAEGRFAHLSGADFLAMVARKVAWLRPRIRPLVAHLESGTGA